MLDVEAAAERLRTATLRPVDLEHGAGGSIRFAAVSPGSFRFASRQVDTASPVLGVSRSDWVRENGPVDDDPPASTRGQISGWSQKSRVRMRRVFGEFDYSPMFRRGLGLPKFVTLTLPHNWERIAPTPAVFKKNLVDNALKRSFRRDWGYDLVGIWKMEFQDRKSCRRDGCHDPKAPHLHMIVAAPSGECPKTGESFETWLRTVWARTCRHADASEQEYRDHLAKGVYVDDTYSLTGTDAKRIADYFVKHGLFAAKEYQNQPPALWGGKPGRFWGYWGLKKAIGEVEMGYELVGASDDKRNYVRPARCARGNESNDPIPLGCLARRDHSDACPRRCTHEFAVIGDHFVDSDP